MTDFNQAPGLSIPARSSRLKTQSSFRRYRSGGLLYSAHFLRRTARFNTRNSAIVHLPVKGTFFTRFGRVFCGNRSPRLRASSADEESAGRKKDKDRRRRTSGREGGERITRGTSTDNQCFTICQPPGNKLSDFYSRLYNRVKYLHPSLIANSDCPFERMSERVLNA